MTEVKKRHWQQDYETKVMENNKVLQGTERKGKRIENKTNNNKYIRTEKYNDGKIKKWNDSV